ncbi:MAG: SurA N-terminal domain-containing protein [Deltaproteobacteria bacterium]|nr:SurA N-terminal domain-containing protein [Deltaproteobacteria bacterium]
MRHVILATMLATGTAHAAPVGAVVEIDRSIAHVGDAVIWESDVASRVKAGADRAAVIENLIDDELVLAEGTKAGISIDKSEVLAALDEIKKQNNLDDAGLDKALADNGYTRARYLVDLDRQLHLLRTKNQLVALKVMIEDAAVDAEIKVRKLPATDENKQTVKTELRRAAMEKLQVEWLKNLRKRAYITRRP